MIKIRWFLLIVVVMLVVTGLSTKPSAAHSTGASFEATSTPYRMDIGYDPPAPQVGDRQLFDFNLWDIRTGDRAPFDDVWVRLESEDGIYLATGVFKADIGPTTLLYLIPPGSEGVINVHARYERDGKALAETSFPLQISPSDEGSNPNIFVALAALGGALLGAVVTWIFKKKISTALKLD